MKIGIICFTAAGAVLCEKMAEKLSLSGHSCAGFIPEKFLSFVKNTDHIEVLNASVGEWTKEQFECRDALLFIGAAGIAVRAAAPYLKDKTRDPAIVVVDDMGRFAVSLLSGHLGGANDLAREAAAAVGAVPVITTATDNHNRFAVDIFAKKNGLSITDMNLAKMVSADLLSGKMVGFFSDFPVKGDLPDGLMRDTYCQRNVWLTVKERPEADTGACKLKKAEILRLIPKIVIVGIGCRKGISREAVQDMTERVLRQWNIASESVAAMATIDIKKAEEGLVGCAGRRGIPLFTYSAETLMEAEGDFTASAFVRETTGADNVCERAAMVCAEEMGGGRLFVKKQAGSGVTVALAVRDWKVTV